MVILIRKRHVAYLVLLCCFVAGLSAVLWHGNAAFTAAFAPEKGTPFTVVVFAGHGREDGRAVGGVGTVGAGDPPFPGAAPPGGGGGASRGGGGRRPGRGGRRRRGR